MWRKNSDQQTLYFWFFSKCCFAYSNKQCLSCWWQLNYFIPEHFDKWFSEFWFLRILITPKKAWTEFICHMFNLFEMHVLCCKSNKEGVKGQGDTLYDHQLLHCVITREKIFRNTEYTRHSDFFCQPVWIVICTNCWCNFPVAPLKSTELNLFPVQGAWAASLVPGCCHGWIVPTLAPWPCTGTQWDAMLPDFWATVKDKGRSRNGPFSPEMHDFLAMHIP